MRFLSAVSFVSILFVLTACSQDKSVEPPAAKPTPIKTGKVRHVQEREFVSVSGTVTSPDDPVPVSFLVSGKVIEVGPREGDYVKKGQFLAAIDPVDYKLSLQAASAQAGQAKVALARSKDEYARMKFLYESRSLAQNDFEKYRAAWLSAKEQVDQAIANQKLAQKRLTDASLYAPADGFISKRSIEPGQTASSGNPVFEIVKLDPVEINVGVPETDIHLVRVGQTAAVTIPAMPTESFEGKVRVINVSADPNTRTYMTRILVPNPAHILRVGMVAEARIEGDRTIELMTLPAETILRDPQGATIVFVYYPEQQRVYAKRVERGAVYGREIAIQSGLSGDETIVFAGQEKLRDGTIVSLVDETAPGGPQNPLRKEEVRQ
ncbi:efflux RND transporter periplasmic adaptor subunit [Desulforhabdus amnigena]|jgi:RND family efflux transporter MFP subunit|uniref:efflux RND transporter periplasmic adaptor subunit n=1 Tax=Desulforhabdus amnigena TaxID=40218 RepID=UPI00169325C7|nr:efflux RND transporter periplasmic adaptor subunit [Desulforhabdus amnigena]NLJ29675.1 efflux RND transporter periplasmic adaptor subunit [Deltaproteobacteria bacterium]